MDLLKQRILTEGKNLGKGILKVDRFINHQVDPILMDACGAEFARLFAGTTAVKILTAEISGIAPALMAGKYLKLPVVYARKTKPVTMPSEVYITVAPSHTKGHNTVIFNPNILSQPRHECLLTYRFIGQGQPVQVEKTQGKVWMRVV